MEADGRLSRWPATGMKRWIVPSTASRYRPAVGVPNQTLPSGVEAMLHTVSLPICGYVPRSKKRKLRRSADSMPSPAFCVPNHRRLAASTCRLQIRLSRRPSSARQMR